MDSRARRAVELRLRLHPHEIVGTEPIPRRNNHHLPREPPRPVGLARHEALCAAKR